jgi:hypothetical protein
MKIFGREPALVMAFLSSLITVFSAIIFHLSDTQQGGLNAVVVGLFGFITAALLEKEKFVPALVGLAKAVVAVAISFGLHWSPEVQGLVLTLVSTAAALWYRPQVVASVPPEAAP